jgi:carbon storage regulator
VTWEQASENQPTNQGEVMLVLTRKKGETLVINGDIRVTVLAIEDNNQYSGTPRVRIGIAAPPNVRIDREEIHNKIQEQNNG